jgi:hypothetical protein
MWVTTGARWSGTTTTSSPFAKVKCVTPLAVAAFAAGTSEPITPASNTTNKVTNGCVLDTSIASAMGFEHPRARPWEPR